MLYAQILYKLPPILSSLKSSILDRVEYIDNYLKSINFYAHKMSRVQNVAPLFGENHNILCAQLTM